MTPAEELRARLNRMMGGKLPDRVVFSDVADGGVLIDPGTSVALTPAAIDGGGSITATLTVSEPETAEQPEEREGGSPAHAERPKTAQLSGRNRHI